MARKPVVKQQDNNKHVDLDRLKAIGFQKGKSGNPNGLKPGTIRLSTEIKRVADEVCNDTGLTYLHTLLVVMFLEAINGDKETRDVLFDRGWGTLVQKNVLMQFSGEVLKMAEQLGLNADDLRGSATLSGLLEVAGPGPSGSYGTEEAIRREASATETTIENYSENS